MRRGRTYISPAPMLFGVLEIRVTGYLFFGRLRLGCSSLTYCCEGVIYSGGERSSS